MGRPKLIILLRHGESQANVCKDILKDIPDHRIELSEKGRQQSIEAGKELKSIVGNEKVQFYVSPYKRSMQTYQCVSQAFDTSQCRFYEEPRLREQDFGNFQEKDKMENVMKERDNYGRFFYRFPNGESGADVYDRISTFLETLHRDFQKPDECGVVVIISHGLTIRLFLMRWFHWTVDNFESFDNPRNCEYFIMQMCDDTSKYKLKTELRKYKPKEHNHSERQLCP